MNGVTIVMYHYVREIAKSRFPEIKGLETEQFLAQLSYLKKNYTFVSLKDCVAAIDANEKVPSNCVLLTFDDGYLDHYQTVFPILSDLKIPGAFFPPGKAIVERKLLDVNKIHFLLASVESIDLLVEEIFAQLDHHRSEWLLPANETLYSQLAVASRFDSAKVIFTKRLLQTYLPIGLRSKIVNHLFERHVSKDEVSFSYDLYLTENQIGEMLEGGMEFGSHCWNHFWLSSLSKQDQEIEIDLSLQFLNRVGAATSRWAMCYPYGDYNQDTLEILRKKDCAIGFTTKVGTAELDREKALILPRMDTNDFPKSV